MNPLHHLAQADLNLLVVLDELIRSRSTTIAARRLGRTQSAVSHALARLRDLFGDPLLVRAGAAMRLTATAEGLAVPLRDVLEQASSLLTRRSGSFDPGGIARTFTLAGSDYSELLLFPALVPLLRREAPGVDLVSRVFGDDVERAIQAREVDLAVVTQFRGLSGIVQEKIGHEEMRVLLRKGHPAARVPLTVEAYAALDHALVSPRGLPGSAVDSALEPLGLTRRIVLRTPHFGVAAHLVRETDLVVTLPRSFAERMAAELRLVTREVPVPLRGFTFWIGYSASFQDDPAHRWLRGRVLEAARAAIARKPA